MTTEVKMPAEIVDLPRVRLRIEKLVSREIERVRPETHDGVKRVELANLRTFVAESLADLAAFEIPRDDPAKWPAGAREEIFGAWQMAWAATAFRTRAAAELLGVDAATADVWMQSTAWAEWSRDAARRTPRIATVHDIALQRAAEILMIQSNDPKIIGRQDAIIRAVLASTREQFVEKPTPPTPPAPPEPTPLHERVGPMKPAVDVGNE